MTLSGLSIESRGSVFRNTNPMTRERLWLRIHSFLEREDLFFPFRIFCQSFLIWRAWLVDLSRAQGTLWVRWWVRITRDMVTLPSVSGVQCWPRPAVPRPPRGPGPGGGAAGGLRDARPDQPGHLLPAAVWLLAVPDPGQAADHHTLHSLPVTQWWELDGGVRHSLVNWNKGCDQTCKLFMIQDAVF